MLKFKLSGEGQAALIKYGLISFGLWLAYSKLRDSDLPDLPQGVRDKAFTLGQGLKNPLDALGALAGSVVGIEPKVSGGIQSTDNFNYYLQLNGGIEKYLEQKRAGTFTGEPYNSSIDYKKELQNKSLFAFFL